jgi:hypothetical protein
MDLTRRPYGGTTPPSTFPAKKLIGSRRFSESLPSILGWALAARGGRVEEL